jgi:hypothetical protein
VWMVKRVSQRNKPVSTRINAFLSYMTTASAHMPLAKTVSHVWDCSADAVQISRELLPIDFSVWG